MLRETQPHKHKLYLFFTLLSGTLPIVNDFRLSGYNMIPHLPTLLLE